MAFPILPVAAAVGIYFLLTGKKKKKKAPTGGAGPIVKPDEVFPWGKQSDATVGWQAGINAVLFSCGYNPVVMDGKLGAVTCAAGRFVATSTLMCVPPVPSLHPDAMGVTCRSFGAPPTLAGTKAPGSGDTVPPDLAATIQAAIDTGDTDFMRMTAVEVEARGYLQAASSLRSLAGGLDIARGAAAGGAAAAAGDL